MTREEIFQSDADRHPAALPSGTLLRDQFRIGRVLGVGGFGITYLAFDEVLEMAVAVKEYLPNHISVRRDDGEQVQPQTRIGTTDFHFGMERFLQEARTLAKFEDHPNIVRVRTFFEENGTAYLVMNYYRGRTLDEYLMTRDSLMTEAEALYVAHEVLDGLEAAHGEGILHRDVDPSNIYLADSGRVVLLDFGAARMAVGERTQTLSVMLKRGYAPHEQYYSHGQQGPWTDVYACSATLYRLLTGFKPPEAAGRVPDDDLVPPQELTPTLSDDTHTAVMKGLALWPQDRPQSIPEFRTLLPPSPGSKVAGWRPSSEPESAEADGPTSAGAQLKVTAPVDCRLFIDGDEEVVVRAETPCTVEVAPGVHRLRAIRAQEQEGGTATVTASDRNGTASPSTSNFSLDMVMWQRTVDATLGAPTPIDISFEADDPATQSIDGGPTDESASDESASDETASGQKASGQKASGQGSDEGASAAPPSRNGTTSSGSRSLNDTQTGRFSDRSRRDRSRSGTSEGDAPEERASERSASEERQTGNDDRAFRGPGDAGDGVPEPPRDVPANPASNRLTRRDRGDGATPSDQRSVRDRQAARSGSSASTSTGQRSSTTMRTATLLVRSDADGRLFVGDRRSIELNEGSTRSIQVAPGTHQLRAVEADGQGTWAQEVTLVASAPTSVSIMFTRPSTTEIPDTASSASDWTETMDVVSQASADATQSATTTVSRWAGRAAVRVRHAAQGLGQAVAGGRSVSPRIWIGAATVVLALVLVAGIGSWWVTYNQPPTASSESIHTPTGESVINVVSNDDDPDADPLVLKSVDTLPAGVGSASIRDSTSLHVQLSASFAGRLDVGYTVTDRNGGTARSHVSVYQPFGDSPPLHVVSKRVAFPQDVAVADLDGDGDRDVLVASYNDRIVWLEHLQDPTARDGHTYSEPRVLDNDAEGAISVDVADLDGDGDQDVLAAAFRDDRIVWYENLTAQPSDSTEGSNDDGTPVVQTSASEEATFSARRIFISGVQGAVAVRTSDVDGDGDPDVIAASRSGDWIGWCENRGLRSDGIPNFSRMKPVASSLAGMEDVRLTDLDGDGDDDVLVAAYAEDSVYWIENRGDGTFAEPHAVTTGAADPLSVASGDFDGDGDGDVLVGLAGSDRVVWYPHRSPGETADSVRTFGAAQEVAANVPDPESVDAADLDGDGRPDVITSSFTRHVVAWHVNRNDGEDWSTQTLARDAREAMVARALDLDGDGDLDVLTASQANDTVAWFENRIDRVVTTHPPNASPADSTGAPSPDSTRYSDELARR